MEESQSLAGVKKYLKIAVFYNNVSRVTALGELLYGVEKKHKISFVLTYVSALELVSLLTGNLFFGNRGFSDEFGHINSKS